MPPDQAALPERIGPYRIVRELGRGGMGIVYLAEQESPVRRTVALKIIRPRNRALDSDHILARFRAEGQTLARMKHSSIAQIFDAGESEDGEPYFVMEHLEGMPITTYCDQEKLSVEQRLELFVDVCRGVQHAHQKGVIHRDLKPSNILVVQEGAKATPKIIDFGVAKQIDRDGLKTMQGEILGSPSFMSPEQLGATVADVDSRSDVYSLGALLYQLLVGAEPFVADRETFFQFLFRMAEETPDPPSRRLEIVEETTARVAQLRDTSADRLVKRLRGDLDWVVMKAMAKERDQRYATASELAEDICRHLRNEPVIASPLGRMYRFGKFVRRHKISFAAGTVATLALVIAVVVTNISLARAIRSEAHARKSESQARAEAARATAINQFLEKLLQSVDPSREGRDVRVIELIDQQSANLDQAFAGQPEVEASVRTVVGAAYSALGDYQKARLHLEAALPLLESTNGRSALQIVAARDHLARLNVFEGRYAEAIDICRRTLELHREVGTEGDQSSSLQTLSLLAGALYKAGEYEEAEATFRQSLAGQEALLGRTHSDTIQTMVGLAHALKRNEASRPEAEAFYQEALAERRKTLGDHHPSTLEAFNSVANIFTIQRRFEEAEPIYRRTLELRTEVLGEEHPVTLLSVTNWASVVYKLGRYSEAEALFRTNLERQERVLGEAHPNTLLTMNNLGNSLRRQGRLAEATQVYRDTLQRLERVVGPTHDETVRTLYNMTTVLLAQGRYDEVIELADMGLTRRPDLDFFAERSEEARTAQRSQ